MRKRCFLLLKAFLSVEKIRGETISLFKSLFFDVKSVGKSGIFLWKKGLGGVGNNDKTK